MRVEPHGEGQWRVETTGVSLAALLDRIAAATGVPITMLVPVPEEPPVAVAAGPAPLDRLVRQLVRPHGVAVVYAAGRGPRRAPARPVRIVVVPADRAAPSVAASRVAEVPAAGARWRLEDLGPSAEPARREAAVLALGEALDDPEAVALLKAVAYDDTGLAADDPARRLARRLLAVIPGGADEGDEEE